jgi:Flp pilus assembly pilin Flp
MKRLDQVSSKDAADNGRIEYGVLAAGLALALVAVLAQIGGTLNTVF